MNHREIAFFNQAALEAGCKLIASMNSGQADALIKTFNLINPFYQTIVMINSEIVIPISDTTILHTNVTNLIDSNINMSFSFDKNLISELKHLKANSDVLILDDPKKTGGYCITNGKVFVELTKTNFIKPPVVPDLSEEHVNSIVENYDSEEASTIKNFCNSNLLDCKKSEYVDIGIFKNQLGFIRRQDCKKYYLGEFSGFEYEKMQPNFLLRSYSFLPILGDSVSFGVFQFKHCKDMFCLKTIVARGFNMVFNIYEKINLLEKR